MFNIIIAEASVQHPTQLIQYTVKLTQSNIITFRLLLSTIFANNVQQY